MKNKKPKIGINAMKSRSGNKRARQIFVACLTLTFFYGLPVFAGPIPPAPEIVSNAQPSEEALTPTETLNVEGAQDQSYPQSNEPAVINGSDAAQTQQAQVPQIDAPQEAAQPQEQQADQEPQDAQNSALTPEQLLRNAGIAPNAAIEQTQDDAINNLPLPGVAPPIDESLLNEPAFNQEQQQAKIKEDAYNAAVQGIFPMNTDQIRRLLQTQDKTNEAVETPLFPYPKPEVTFTTVSLDPGQPPVTIKLAVGHVTTISMVDITGQPWSVQDISWAGNFEVVQPESGSHVLRITPLSDFAFGNLSMRLVNLNTPVTFSLRTGREEVQYRLDIRVPEYGPAASTPIIDQGGVNISAGDKTLTSVLDGVAPSDAVKLIVSGVDGRTSAYKTGETVYLRTPLTLLSPAWQSSVRSADGMNVYALGTAPILLLSDKGRMVRASVQDQPVISSFSSSTQ